MLLLLGILSVSTAQLRSANLGLALVAVELAPRHKTTVIFRTRFSEPGAYPDFKGGLLVLCIKTTL
jgi:hypothetical protein